MAIFRGALVGDAIVREAKEREASGREESGREGGKLRGCSSVCDSEREKK